MKKLDLFGKLAAPCWSFGEKQWFKELIVIHVISFVSSYNLNPSLQAPAV